MGGILSRASNAKQQKAVGALQFQTSQHGGVIPLAYGTTGKWSKGDRTSWETQIKTRQLGQHEDKRIYQQ